MTETATGDRGAELGYGREQDNLLGLNLALGLSLVSGPGF
jgi:hypothetical protein